MTRIIIPNYHTILIHFPLGMLGLGILIELLTFLWKPIGLRAAGRWMILLGSLFSVPTLLAGIFALYDDLAKGPNNPNSWNDILATIPSKDWKLAKYHFLWEAGGCLASLIATISWVGACDLWRKRLYPVSLILLLGAQSAFVIGAWHGGEMVYRRGFGVAGQYVAPTESWPDAPTREDYINGVDPIELHIIAAGFVIALALAGIGVTLRKSAVIRAEMKRLMPVVASPYPPGESPTESMSLPLMPSPEPQIPAPIHSDPMYSAPIHSDPRHSEVVIVVPEPPMPVSRIWLVAALMAIITILGGFFVALDNTLSWPGITDEFKKAFSNFHDSQRVAMHLIFGSSILLLTLILAILAKSAPRKRSTLGIFSGLLILVAVAQVWIGILLLYDKTDGGPLLHFQAASTQPVMASNP